MAYKKLKLWFDVDLAEMLSFKIKKLEPSFNQTEFIIQVKDGVGQMELKDRVEWIADSLYKNLERDYKAAVKILVKILGPENTEETGMFTNFYWVMPIAKLVEKYGMEHFSLSMMAIEEITKRNTGEYCIRPFITTYPKRTISQMLKWSKSKNFHVRRLSCEGGRPRLPWASKLQMFINDPSPLIPIMNQLKSDPSRYVQKSVANCMHDILKDNPETGKKLILSWSERPSNETKWIIKHALRTLRKKKDDWALNLMQKLT